MGNSTNDPGVMKMNKIDEFGGGHKNRAGLFLNLGR
jgi:hypothetical protein